jgi:DNA-binding transcriptional LysR family regulator
VDKLLAMRTFRRVVELGGFSAAARDLELSNAGVSKHVKDLEQELGVSLLTRTTRRVMPTEAGQGYYERCARILDDVDEAELALTALSSAPRGRLRINAPMTFGLLHVSPLIGRFHELYPEVQLDLVLNDRRVDIVAEGFDVGLRIRAKLEDSSLVSRRICAVRTALVASPEYLKLHGLPSDLEDLAGHKLLAYSLNERPDRWSFRTPAGELKEIEISPAVMANSGMALRAPLLAGVGITLTPTFTVGPELKSGRLVTVLPEHGTVTYSLFALYPPSRHLAPKVRAFIDFISDRLRSPPWE